jgi:16S rRNA processing protein RimM
MRCVVGRVGRAHGLLGEVAVEVRTDDPELRFATGSQVYPALDQQRRPARAPDRLPGSLSVAGSRWHSGRLLVRFAEVADRSGAEALAGTLLEAEVDLTAAGDDPDEFHDLALIGLTVQDRAGQPIGRVAAVSHLPAQDLLVVERAAPVLAAGNAPGVAHELLVPFVSEIVPVVDIAGGFLVVDLPPGLDPADPDPADAGPTAAGPTAPGPAAPGSSG